MDQRNEARNPTTPDVTPVAPAAKQGGDRPLWRYLASLEQGDEGQQLLRHIRLYVHKAKLEGEQSTHEIALEIMQELMAEALHAEQNFDSTRSPRLWLLGIAVNLVKRRREKLFHQRQHESLASDLVAPEEVTEEQLFDRLAAQAGHSLEQEVLAAIGIEELLAQLSPAERRLIELSVLHGMKGAEVAQELGITPVNARVRCHRLLMKLRTILLAQEAGRGEKQSHE